MIALIRVPSEIQLSVAPSKAKQLLEIDTKMEKLVDMERVMNEAVRFIESEVVKASDEVHYRLRPLTLTRMSRGGKTTTLASIHDRLKSRGKVNPIVISFSCHDEMGYRRRAGETQSQAILRLIAAQLVDCSREEAYRLVVDSAALDKHLGDNVVLLIDELNRIHDGAPLDADATALLLRMFLDRAGRFLVFSTHVRMVLGDTTAPTSALIGATSNPSSRGIKALDMSLANSLEELQTLPGCKNLTEFQAAFYGYIPSLVKCTVNDCIGSVSDRFYASTEIIDPRLQQDILQRFTRELLTGDRDPQVAKYYGHFSSMGFDQMVSYPLCYITLILKELNQGSEAVKTLCAIIDKLEVHTCDVGSGLDWEYTVQLAVILRCLYSQWSFFNSTFSIVPSSVTPELKLVKLPQGLKNLVAARGFINKEVSSHSTHTLLYFDAAETCFKDLQGLVVYTNGLKGMTRKVIKIGFQAKLSGDNEFMHVIDEKGLDNWYLFRGRISAMNPRDTTTTTIKSDWFTLCPMKELKQFLGTSLQLTVPKSRLVDAELLSHEDFKHVLSLKRHFSNISAGL